MSEAARTVRLAWATYSSHPPIQHDEALAISILHEQASALPAPVRFEVTPVPWDSMQTPAAEPAPAPTDRSAHESKAASPAWLADPSVWKRFDAVIVRSCWNYHLKVPLFFQWLDSLAAAGVRVLNPLPIIRWNSVKTYLGELGALGVSVCPSLFILAPSEVDSERAASPLQPALAKNLSPSNLTFVYARGTDPSVLERSPFKPAPPLRDLLRMTGWKVAVLKPLVSAGSHNTVKVTAENADAEEAVLDRIMGSAGTRGAVLQEFIEELEHDDVEGGEFSLLYFGGRFSHAIQKLPPKGDFRCMGGARISVEPHAALRSTADHVLSLLTSPEPLLYARVDMVLTKRHYRTPPSLRSEHAVADASEPGPRVLLMELELIEPFFFLGAEGPAPNNGSRNLAEQILAQFATN